jgi:hypothetical protein
MAALAAMMGAALPTVAGVGAPHVAMAADAQPAGPSIQYLESVAHASDPNTFHPGSRVALKLRARPQVKALADPVPTGTPSADPSAPADPSPSASVDPSAAPTPLPPGPTSGSGLKRQVVGFLPYWEVNASDLTLRYDLLDDRLLQRRVRPEQQPRDEPMAPRAPAGRAGRAAG